MGLFNHTLAHIWPEPTTVTRLFDLKWGARLGRNTAPPLHQGLLSTWKLAVTPHPQECGIQANAVPTDRKKDKTDVTESGAGEMAQLATLQETLGSVLGTHMGVRNCCWLFLIFSVLTLLGVRHPAPK